MNGSSVNSAVPDSNGNKMKANRHEKVSRFSQPPAFWILAGFLVLAFFLTFASSELPDGFEASAHRVGLEEGPPTGAWTLDDLFPREWVSRVVGIAITGLIAWACCAWMGARRRERHRHTG